MTFFFLPFTEELFWEWESVLYFWAEEQPGGTDMLAAIIQKYMRHYTIAQIMQFIDGSIVLVGMYVFGIRKGLYAIIAVYLVTKVSDGLIEGLKFSKAVHIITDKPEAIARMIMHDLDRGVTGNLCKGNVFRTGKTDALLCGWKERTGSAERKKLMRLIPKHL